MPADVSPGKRARRGFVIGELLIALLLLAVAVSSLAALMYSVSRRPAAPVVTECVASDAARGKCVPENSAAAVAKPVRSGCVTRSLDAQRDCKDTLLTQVGSDETIVRSRSDSAAMAMLAKKAKPSPRTDRGFIR
ncbi:MAG TPA: hypothetical protein VK494_01580 [Gemmatimonadaceae bacterium]|jgi:uncharacterized low-complexity protein|nr:hypothetical protein [Gemmatimonadaceae bacterium]